MNLKAMATVFLAGLAVAAVGCGNLSDPPAAMSVRYASDGTLVVFAGSVIDSYGPDLTQKKVHIPVQVAGPGPLFSASDDGRVAAVVSSVPGGAVQLFDLSSGQETSVIPLGQSPSGAGISSQGLTLSPTGDLLFVAAGLSGPGDSSGEGGAMFDTSIGARLWSGKTFRWPPFFSPDESTLYAPGNGSASGGSLQGIDSQTGTISLDVPLVDAVKAFGGMADPNTLIAVTESLNPVSGAIESTEIDLLSTADGSVTSQVLLPKNAEFSGGSFGQAPPFHCAPAAGLCVMFAVQIDPNTGSPITSAIQIWSLDGTLVQSIENYGDLAISPDGQYVAVVVDGDVTIYAVSDGSEVKLLPYRTQIL